MSKNRERDIGREKGWFARVTSAFEKGKRQGNCQNDPERVEQSRPSNVGAPEAAKEVSDPERRDQRRFELLYTAELSARYHRRRATFLTNADTATNAITLCAGASSLGGLLANASGAWPVAMAAIVTLTSIIKIVTRLGSAANSHTGWFRRWSSLLVEVELSENPEWETLSRWAREQGEIERDCVAELRALCIDCENITNRKLGIVGRQRLIGWLQRRLMQFGTWQTDFPFVPEGAQLVKSGEMVKSRFGIAAERGGLFAAIVWFTYWIWATAQNALAWQALPVSPRNAAAALQWLDARDVLFDGVLCAIFWPFAVFVVWKAGRWVCQGYSHSGFVPDQ